MSDRRIYPKPCQHRPSCRVYRIWEWFGQNETKILLDFFLCAYHLVIALGTFKAHAQTLDYAILGDVTGEILI